MIWAIIILLGIVLIMVVKQTISTSNLQSPPSPPPPPLSETNLQNHVCSTPTANFCCSPCSQTYAGFHAPQKAQYKVDHKNTVITEMMIHGTISFERAKELGVKGLAGVIFRLRKIYDIDNVVVDGKFLHYKLIKLKGE
jgi:hypothetical protein